MSAEPANQGQDRRGAALIHVLSACVMHRTEEWSPYMEPNSTAGTRLHVDLHATILIRAHEGLGPLSDPTTRLNRYLSFGKLSRRVPQKC